MTKLVRCDDIWRAVTFLVRLDMAAGIILTAALVAWPAWH
jgi:hypothetical protein